MNRKRNSIEKWIKKKNTLGNTYQTCFFGSPRGGAKLKKKPQKKEKRRESNRWSEMERKSLRMWRRRRVIFWSIRRVHVADNKPKKKKKRGARRSELKKMQSIDSLWRRFHCIVIYFYFLFFLFIFFLRYLIFFGEWRSIDDGPLISFDWIDFIWLNRRHGSGLAPFCDHKNTLRLDQIQSDLRKPGKTQ